MPYTPPAEQPPADDAPESQQARFEQRTQEREVRLTAQHILTVHLRPGDDDRPAAPFWPDTDPNPNGATLIHFNLIDCQPCAAEINSARFVGNIRFDRAMFAGTACFDRAIFDKSGPFCARFDGTTFTGGARFNEAMFSDVISATLLR